MNITSWILAGILLFFIAIIATSANRRYLLKTFVINALVMGVYVFLFSMMPSSESFDMIAVFAFIGFLLSHIVILMVFMIGRYNR
jgi:hypothetical protein